MYVVVAAQYYLRDEYGCRARSVASWDGVFKYRTRYQCHSAHPDKELHPHFLRCVDEVLSLRYFAHAVRSGSDHLWIPGVRRLSKQLMEVIINLASSRRTPNTALLPRSASWSDSLSHRLAWTTSTPFAISALLAAESIFRDIARGVNLPSARTAFSTAPPNGLFR